MSKETIEPTNPELGESLTLLSLLFVRRKDTTEIHSHARRSPSKLIKERKRDSVRSRKYARNWMSSIRKLRKTFPIETTGFTGSDYFDEDGETSDEEDVKIIDSGRPWKFCKDIKIKTEILDEIENFSANDELEIDQKEVPLITKKLFICAICKIDIPTEDEFRTHMIAHNPSKLFQCGFCGQRFSRLSSLKNHLQSYYNFNNEHRPSKFQDRSTVRFRGRCPKERCFECGIREKKGSRDRKARFARKKSFECSICKKNFLRRSSLRSHRIVHTADSPYKCDLCPARFKRSSVLKTHKLTHTNVRKFECDICKHRFHLKGALKHHILAHYGVRPYKCEDCGKRYRRSWGLKVHMYRHTGVKRFECDLCKARFSVKTKLAKHIYQHTGEKPYKCELCFRQYDERYLLKSHKCPVELGDSFEMQTRRSR